MENINQNKVAPSLGHEIFTGQGEIVELMRKHDWARTPVGPLDSWPQSLRTSTSICLNSRFPTVIYWGPDFAMIYNEGYAPILGKKHPSALGKPVREVWAEIWAINGPMLNGVITTGVPTWSENKLLNLNRYGFLEECYFTYSFAPIIIEGGKPGGIFCTCTETTERIIAERRLTLLRELGAKVSATRSLEEICTIGCQVLSSSRQDVTFAQVYLLESSNNSAKLMSSAGNVPIEKKVSETISFDERNPIWPLPTIARTGKIEAIKLLNDLDRASIENSTHTALALPIVRPGEEDRPYGFLIVGLSPQRAFDENYEAFFRLVAGQIATALANARAYEEETKRTQALAEIDRAKTTFFSNISHEFRTPLTLMLAPLESMLSGELGPMAAAMRKETQLLQRNALRLLKLVNTLLDFSRIEGSRMQACYEATDLGTFTAELASAFHTTLVRAGLELKIECPKLSEEIYIDREMWEKIVLNLVSNAFKFTLNGSIRISVRLVGEYAELRVSDTGTGIPPSEISKIFDRFHRVQGSQGRNFEGTGIGLSLVKELVRIQGGKIEVESRLNKGTTFSVKIPRGKNHLSGQSVKPKESREPKPMGISPYVIEAEGWVPEPKGAANDNLSKSDTVDSGVSPLPYRARILLADDNNDMRNYVSRLLSEHWDVHAVSDGLAALTQAKENPPDLVVTDVMMPKLNGIELLKALRTNPETKDIPVILLSARAGEEATVEGMDMGADDYLAKPFSARELISRAHALLKKHRQSLEILRGKNQELSRVNSELRTFAAVASHDLKEPLRMVMYYLQLLEEEYLEKLDAKAEEYIGVAVSGAKHMYDLIEALIVFSSVAVSEEQMVAVDTYPILEQVLSNLKPLIIESGAQIEVAELPKLKADKVRLIQLFQNLIENAIKYRKKGVRPQIAVTANRKDGRFTFSVSDNGVGIAPEYFEKIFIMFQRLDPKNSPPGTGIGLAICKKIVEQQGGRIWVESEKEKGSTFYFTIPERVL